MLQYLQPSSRSIWDRHEHPRHADAGLDERPDEQGNNLFLAPYEYDYIDPSNFYGIFYNGGRHDHRIPEYDALVAQADANPVWEERVSLYRQAEQVMIDNASIVPLVHPIQMFAVGERLSGPASSPTPRA
jgi:ABC-type transport system substrate-binding protein